jgi:hypothetical protein
MCWPGSRNQMEEEKPSCGLFTAKADFTSLITNSVNIHTKWGNGKEGHRKTWDSWISSNVIHYKWTTFQLNSLLSHDFASLATRLTAPVGLAANIPGVTKRGQTKWSLQNACGRAWFQRSYVGFYLINNYTKQTIIWLQRKWKGSKKWK